MTKFIGVLALVLALGCGKSGEEQAKEDMAKEAAKMKANEPPPPPPPEKKAMPDQPAAAPKDKAPEPDPADKAAVEKAFKLAMNEQRDKDVLHYCDVMKPDDKSSIQTLMGCTLSACRTKDADSAKKYSSLLPSTKDGKALHDQAVKICAASGVSI